jgi:hypothetical protein
MNYSSVKLLVAAGSVALIGALYSAGCSSSSTPTMEVADTGTPMEEASPDCSMIGAGNGQYSFGSAACDSCVTTNCCAEFAGCITTGGGCEAILMCLGTCIAAHPTDGDTVCGDMCTPDASAGDINAANALITCNGNMCASSCM